MYRRGEVGQVARALRLLDSLRGFRRGRRVEDLAAELGVSSRTVRRDLGELEAAGMEIERPMIDGRAGARLLERSYSYVAITRRERYTLRAVRSMFDVLRGTPLHDDIESVNEKLAQRLDPSERDEDRTFVDRFVYIPDGGTKAYAGKEDIIDAVMTGVLSRKVVRFVYVEHRGRTQRGHLAPYALALYKHGLYVIGRRLKSPEDGANVSPGVPGVFAIERFSTAEHLRGASFTMPPDFDIKSVMHGAFGIHIGDPDKAERVVVEFSKAKAALVRVREWHPTQRLENLPDGRVRIEFPCTNLTPVVSWVLEWGPHARAVEPPALVAQVVGELEAAQLQYQG